MEPYFYGLYKATFSKAMKTAGKRQYIFKVKNDNSENVMEEALSGPSESEAKWKGQITEFKNVLLSVFVVDIVSRYYIICENKYVDHKTMFQYFIESFFILFTQ